MNAEIGSRSNDDFETGSWPTIRSGGSQIGGGHHMCKVLLGCPMTRPNAPINIHVEVLDWRAELRSGTGKVIWWGWGLGDGGIGNVPPFPLNSIEFY